MEFPEPVAAILATLSEGTDQVLIWPNTAQTDLAWGEVYSECFAMLREDDPEIASNPRLRIQAHLDLMTAYALLRADEQEDPLPDTAALATFELELRLPPARALWPREALEQLAQQIADWPVVPGCRVDYENDELPYGHTLMFECTLTKGEFQEDFEWNEDEEERPHLSPLFHFIGRALNQSKLFLLGER